VLSPDDISGFLASGYVAIRGAVPPGVARACQDVIWSELTQRGLLRDEPSTWTEPVVRIPCPEGGPFAEAGTAPLLREACDQLIGPSRWWRRAGVGGTIPVRFPSESDRGDAGWHIEASYQTGGQWRVNAGSRGRGLLALYLFTDVDRASAPARLRPARISTSRQSWPRPGPAGWTRSRRDSGPRAPARTVPRSWPPAGPGTCSCATRSWCTPPPGRTGAGSRG
jgi:hypothetical protein